MVGALAAAPDPAAARVYVRRRVQAAGTSFYWAMRLLPRPKQEAMYAIYAFCRELDDIADEPGSIDDKRRALAFWRDELGRIRRGNPTTLIGQALSPAVEHFGLDEAPMIEILRGVEMDVDGPIRAPSLVELELYCDRVAGAVGLLSLAVFGCRDARGAPFARATGAALQLTNILRDVAADADQGRLYLPRDLLHAAGIHGDRPEDVLRHPRLAEVCGALAEITDQRFRLAQELLAAMPPEQARTLRPAVIMTRVYRTLFERLRARGWSRPRQTVRVGRAEKLWIAFRAAILAQ